MKQVETKEIERHSVKMSIHSTSECASAPRAPSQALGWDVSGGTLSGKPKCQKMDETGEFPVSKEEYEGGFQRYSALQSWSLKQSSSLASLAASQGAKVTASHMLLIRFK